MRRFATTMAVVLVAAACGGGDVSTTDGTFDAAPTTTSTSSVPAPSTTITSTTTPVTAATLGPDATLEGLGSYRYRLTLGITPEPLSDSIRDISAVIGERTRSPESEQLFGQLGGEPVHFISDGERWWDFGDTGEEIPAADFEAFLGASGFLLPSAIAPLLDQPDAWVAAGDDEILGIQTEIIQRTDIAKDVDWEYGSLVRLDVWRNDAGETLKFVAWWATGDNSGFPVSIYEVTDANPEVTIELPNA